MHQVAIAPEDVRDPFEKNVPGIGVGRDGCRTPMQWDSSEFSGFSDVRPWLPLPEDHVRENVVNLDADTRSILSLYKRLIALRKRSPALTAGDYHPIAAQGDLLVYRREAKGRALIIVLNLGPEPIAVTTSAIKFGSEILISTFLDREGERLEGVLDLRGNEGVVVAPPS
jgi:alpha-glucosidase